ncbi:MAG: hypothetical protein AAFV53_35865 [Myxococcota bacterium]
MRFAVAALCVGLLSGCGANARLDEAGAQDAFVSSVVVLTDVQLQVYTAVEASGLAKDIAVESDDGAVRFAGDLDGGWGWDGMVGVDGDVSFSDVSLYGFDLTLDAEEVDVSGLVLDGDIGWTADGGLGFDGDYAYIADVTGELNATGSAEGTVTFAYELELRINPVEQTYAYEAAGSVSGYDISAWDDLLSGSGKFYYDID